LSYDIHLLLFLLRLSDLIPIIEEESAFAVRIRALSAGRSEVRVRIVSAPSGSRLQGLTATYTIDVTEPLRLLSPAELLLAPNSRFQIRTNYDNDPQHGPRYEVSLSPPSVFPFLYRYYSFFAMWIRRFRQSL